MPVVDSWKGVLVRVDAASPSVEVPPAKPGFPLALVLGAGAAVAAVAVLALKGGRK